MFEGSCFLENVREESMQHGGLVKLQKILLSKILGGKELEVTNVHGGINVIKKRLSMKRVLLIVDDVNQLAQLKKLVGGSDWFGLGSRIIITTRDEHLLFAHQVSLVYKVNELHHHEALELFAANAFRGNTLPDNYAKLAHAVLQYAQGLPLALIVLGSVLCGGSIKEWQDALDSYKKVPNPEIQEILQLSYDSLDDPVKEVFLDIACFFKGENKDRVIQILEGCGLHPSYSIKVLKEKALININEENHIWMHDLLEEMGKEVVRQESPTEPGRRSRLWFHEDVYRVLTEGRGTSKVIGILARLPKPYEIRLNTGSFSKLTNLQIFVNYNAIFTSHLTMDLPDELRFIDWPELQYISLPFNNIPEKLVKLDMPYGFMSQLGLAFKCCGNLKCINLERCQLLTEFPDVSEFPNLEELNLNYCVSLVEIHDSVGYLDRLVSLSLSGCHSLVMIVGTIALKSVKYINLGSCRSLQIFPRILEIMECLTYLSLSGTAIKELPSSIGYLVNLEELILEKCENLTSLPCSIYQLQHLVSVNLLGCRKLVTFPKWSPEFSHDLWYLNLHSCKSLKEIPELPPKVEWVDASNCVSLERFAKLSNILENKESQMIQCISLLNCEQLCDNLASEVAKKENISLYKVSLCSLFLSPKQYDYELEVIFPEGECPKWFNHREDSYELVDKSEFCFEFPRDFKFESRGLAICAAVDINKNEIQETKSGGEMSQKGKEEETTDQAKSGVETSQKEEEITHSNFGRCTFVARIGINAESIVERTRYFEAKDMESPHVLLLYIPFVKFVNGPLPPSTCRVSLEHNSEGSVRCRSYGVHLVMPEDEERTDDKNDEELDEKDASASRIANLAR